MRGPWTPWQEDSNAGRPYPGNASSHPEFIERELRSTPRPTLDRSKVTFVGLVMLEHARDRCLSKWRANNHGGALHVACRRAASDYSAAAAHLQGLILLCSDGNE